jgi:hypothetical protein
MMPEMCPTMAAMVVSHVVGPLLRLVAFPIDFFFPQSFIPQKNYVTKIWVHLTFGRSMEVKKYAKKTRKYAS